MNDVSCLSDSSVFNATGHAIGMIIFVESNMDFAVHVGVLRNLIEIAVKNKNKKEEAKKGL